VAVLDLGFGAMAGPDLDQHSIAPTRRLGSSRLR
jgi:hypothetical protein